MVARAIDRVREAIQQQDVELAEMVIADDDVRNDPRSLRRTVSLLGSANCVQPQNYFRPLSWHALPALTR